MRSYLLAAAAAAALLMTSNPAPAQVRAFPSINTSPYAHGSYYYPGYYSYSYPSYYAYGYGYGYPGYFAWSNPYSTWGGSWYLNNPYFYTGYGPMRYPW